MWKRELCPAGMAAPIAAATDGTVAAVACDPARMYRLNKEGRATRYGAFSGDRGIHNPTGVAMRGDEVVLGSQLLGEAEIAGHKRGSWDETPDGTKRGAGDVLVAVHDGDGVTHFAHAHGEEVDTVGGVAFAPDGSIWAVGETRNHLDFGDGHQTAPGAKGRGSAYIVRLTR